MQRNGNDIEGIRRKGLPLWDAEMKGGGPMLVYLTRTAKATCGEFQACSGTATVPGPDPLGPTETGEEVLTQMCIYCIPFRRHKLKCSSTL